MLINISYVKFDPGQNLYLMDFIIFQLEIWGGVFELH